MSVRKSQNGKPSRRKAGRKPGPKARRISFRLTVEDQVMLVTYRPKGWGDCAQFEFRSPHRPPRRILVSETGYLCHFVARDEVKAAKTPQRYARAYVQSVLDGGSKHYTAMVSNGQLSLFG